MQKLTSYDSLTSFGWVCAIVVVLVLRDIPLFDYESYNLVASCVLVAAVAGIVVLLYLQRKIKRRAEDKCQWRRQGGPLGRSKTVPPGVIGQHKCPRQLARINVT